MNDRYENLANRVAVDKTASIVTNQSGCDDNIYNKTDKERLEALKSQKRKYSDDVFALKREMKIKPGWGGGVKARLPRHILDHPKYHNFVYLRARLTELDLDINTLKKRVGTGEPRFENVFVTMVKERYPDIFEEIKAEIKNK